MEPNSFSDEKAVSIGTVNASSDEVSTTEENSDVEAPVLNRNCQLQWACVSKSVQVVEATSGLLRSSITTPTRESNETFQKTGPTNKVILNKVSGSAAPGEILALMGPSGSGKTSLLNILSGRSVMDSGQLMVDSVPAEGPVLKRLKRRIAYVKQADIFFDHLTVRDQLTYTALLRLPGKNKHDKYEEVSRIINLLRLTKCADTPIRLVSGGEKKRVNIGTELLTDPLVIMLDEPTSGLDSTSAVSLICVLHDFAKEGKTVVTSIHQPSSAVFRSFDKLCMLAEGNCVYFGTPSNSLSYLENMGLVCPPGYNAADHWMDLLVVTDTDSSSHDQSTKPNRSRRSSRRRSSNLSRASAGCHARMQLIDAWSTSQQNMEEAIPEQSDKDDSEVMDVFGNKYNTSWLTQLFVLLHRSMKNSRSAIFTTLNIVKCAVIGVMMGLLWFQMPYTEKTVEDRVSYYFFTMTYWVFDAMYNALMCFPLERTIIFKERDSGSYQLSAYFMAKTISEAPTRLALPTIYMIISYWLAGINNKFTIFIASTGCTLLSVLAGESCGLLVGASVMDFEKAMVIMVVVSLTLVVLGGFFIQNIPSFISWMKYLSPFKYAFDASQQLVFDKPVPCDGSGVLPQCAGGSVGSVAPEEIIEWLGVDGSVAFNIGCLCLVILIPRYIAFLCLSKKRGDERS